MKCRLIHDAPPSKKRRKRLRVLVHLEGIFGAQAIADELGLELRKTFYLLERGYLPATRLV